MLSSPLTFVTGFTEVGDVLSNCGPTILCIWFGSLQHGQPWVQSVQAGVPVDDGLQAKLFASKAHQFDPLCGGEGLHCL